MKADSNETALKRREAAFSGTSNIATRDDPTDRTENGLWSLAAIALASVIAIGYSVSLIWNVASQ